MVPWMRGTLKKCLLGLLDTLGDRRGNFLRLAVADADQTFTVADDHEGGEAEATTTLHDLGDTVDRDDSLDVDRLFSAATATVVASDDGRPSHRCAVRAGLRS